MISQEEFIRLGKKWAAADDFEREDMLPFCTEEQRATLSYYYARDQNISERIKAWYDNRPHYNKVIAKHGQEHVFWREQGEKAKEKRKEELKAAEVEKEKVRRKELYDKKNKKLTTDYEILPLIDTTPVKDVKQPKAKSAAKPKRERTSGEGGMQFEPLEPAAPIESLRHNGSIEGSKARAVSFRRPKPDAGAEPK